MKIGIFRALQLGDLLCTVPAIRALYYAYPKAEIVIIGLPWQKFLVNRFTYLHRFIHFPGLPGFPEQPWSGEAVVTFLRKLQAEKFDLLLQMQGNGSIVNPFLQIVEAKRTVGFYRKEDYIPDKANFFLYPEKGSEIHRMLELTRKMGIPDKGDYLEFPLFPADYSEIDSLVDVNKKYICIHPGSRDMKRRWNPEYYAQIADVCIEKGYEIVITGVKEEVEIADAIQAKMSYKPVILVGKTSLGGLGALVEQSSGVISNDTGIAHVASALKKRSLTISQNSDPERWSPLDKTKHCVIQWEKQSTIDDILEKISQVFKP